MVKFSNTLIVSTRFWTISLSRPGLYKDVQAPGAHDLAAQFHTAASKATYIGSAPPVLQAVAPLIWIPLSRRVGRRPILLFSQIIALVGAIGVARSQSYAGALGCRMVMGFGGSAGLCIVPASISDMFFLHEKGTRLGINAFFLVVGPYIGQCRHVPGCPYLSN